MTSKKLIYFSIGILGYLAAGASEPNLPKPQNATNGTIQVYAQIFNEKDLADENLEFISKCYDLVLLAYPFKEVVTKLRSANPKLIILLFNNPYFAFGERFWQEPANKSLEEIAGDWLLRDESGALIYYGGPIYEGLEVEQRIPLMDIRNTDWQKYYAAQSRKYVDTAEMDGLFVDTLDESIPLFALGPGNTFPKDYTEAGWRDSTYQLLQEIENAFAGTEAKILFNGISRPPESQEDKHNWGILQRCDGTGIEAFSIYLPMDKNNLTKQWFFFETMLNDAYSAAENKKMVILEVYADNDTPATHLYALCTFLLIQNEWTYFYFTAMTEAGSTRWRPEWSIDIGQTKGAYTCRDEVYCREFEEGTVWVNPQPHRIIIPLRSAYIDLSGNQVWELSLESFSGTILFASGP